MKNQPRKWTHKKAEIPAAQVLAQRQAAQLRRARNLQRTVKRLTGELARAIVHTDAARLNLARMLCEDTGWSVLANAEVDEVARQHAAARERISALEAMISPAAQALARAGM